MSCASSSYYDYGINTSPSYAGSTQVVSTVVSIASAYSASVAASISASSASAAAASASASYASAAAVPSAGCNILSDFGLGSSFEVYGINGWAGEGGAYIYDQESGWGEVDGFEFKINQTADLMASRETPSWPVLDLPFSKAAVSSVRCTQRADRRQVTIPANLRASICRT